MLYCSKCETVFDEGTRKCPNCGSLKDMREAAGDDYVYLHRADQYTAQRLTDDFNQNNIAYRVEKFDNQRISYLYDSEVMPTDKSIYVKYEDLEGARECSARLKSQLEQENSDTEEFAEMPTKKRIIIQIVSVILFLLLITAVVLAADFVAEWFKGLFAK